VIRTPGGYQIHKRGNWISGQISVQNRQWLI